MISIILKEYENESLNYIHGLRRNKKERRQKQRSEVKGEEELRREKKRKRIFEIR